MPSDRLSDLARVIRVARRAPEGEEDSSPPNDRFPNGRSDQTETDSLGDGLDAVPGPQAELQLADDTLDGAIGVAEPLGDLPGVGPGSQQREDLEASTLQAAGGRVAGVDDAQPGGGGDDAGQQLLLGQRRPGQHGEDVVAGGELG